MNPEIGATDYTEEKNEVKLNLQSKLVLENGLVSLPDPSKLRDGWFAAPHILPNTIYEQVNIYLKDTDAEKAFQGGKSLLLSGHLKTVMTHSISSNIHFCLVKSLYHPKARTNPYTVWICLHKDSGAVVNGVCTCVAE